MVASTSCQRQPVPACDCARMAAAAAISATANTAATQSHGPCWLSAADARIEDRQQTPFSELRGMRHGDGGGGRRGLCSHGARDFEEMRRVVGGGGAGGEHQVIGGAFALAEESTPGAPRQRIPPIERQGRPRHQVGGGIPAAHMSEFVEQHDTAAVFTPIRGALRHEDRRAQDAEGHRHARRGLEHVHFIVDAEIARQVAGEGGVV